MPATALLNSSISCPSFCPGIRRFSGVCSFCLAAQSPSAITQSGAHQQLPINIIARIHILNYSLSTQTDVLRTFQLLGGQDWTTFLLSYLEAFGTETAGFVTASILFLIISWVRAKRRRKRGEKAAQTNSNMSPPVRRRVRRSSREDDEPEPSRWRWPRPSWPQWPSSPWATQPKQNMGLQVMQAQPLISSPQVMHAQPPAVVVQPPTTNQPATAQNLPSMTF